MHLKKNHNESLNYVEEMSILKLSAMLLYTTMPLFVFILFFVCLFFSLMEMERVLFWCVRSWHVVKRFLTRLLLSI